MPYILFSEQEKQSANASDIRSFLASLGQEVKRSGREYTWESPSGKVSINGSEWYSQYERVGGGAVSFVQKFFGASYPDAVRSLLGSCAGQIPSEQSNTFRQSRSKETQTELVLPQKSTDMRRLYGYLLNERCLDRDVVYAFVHAGTLYEDAPTTMPCSSEQTRTASPDTFRNDRPTRSPTTKAMSRGAILPTLFTMSAHRTDSMSSRRRLT